MAFNVFLYGVAYVRDTVAYAGKLDALEKALPRHGYQILRLRRYLAAGVRPGTVAGEAVDLRADIHADYVAVVDNAGARYAVYYLVVHGDTRAGREAAVVEEGRRRAVLDDIPVNLAVELLCGHSGCDALPGDGSRPGGDPAGHAHKLDLAC